MAYLLDTNVLLRWMRPDDAHHEAAQRAIEVLMAQHEMLYVAPQSIAEFWYVATRSPARNGYGLAPAQVATQVQRVERAFALAVETPAIYPAWRQLVTTHQIAGLKIFDARLVAIMQVLGIERILTFNGSDFAAYNVDVVDPAMVKPAT